MSYHSSNSKTIKDRCIESFYFSPNYRYIWGCEIYSDVCKQFKISRIESIEVLGFYWGQETNYQKPFEDIFRMSSKSQLGIVEMDMTLRAYNSLKEEFVLPIEYVKKIEDNKYHVTIPIASYKGIGRFVMGLLDEIVIIKSPAFKTYISNQLKKHSKNYND